MTLLDRRIREAVVVPERDLDELSASIEKLANASPTVPEQLTRLRLSYSVPVDQSARARFDEQLAKAGVEIELRQENLRRVLAMCVLTARFGRPPGRRTQPSLAGDTAAALAAVIARRQGRRPVHPDIESSARYWLLVVGAHLRTATRLPQPPEFSPEFPDIDATSTAAQATTTMVESLKPQLTEYAEDLARWSAELDPAQVTGQAEQLDLIWWLQSARPNLSSEEAALQAGRELATTIRRIPGPPSTDQLLARWLKPWDEDTVRLGDLQALLGSVNPGEIADLCPLSAGDPSISDHQLPLAQAAGWLYEELMLARLVGGET